MSKPIERFEAWVSANMEAIDEIVDTGGYPHHWVAKEMDKMRNYLVYSGKSYTRWKRFYGGWLNRSWQRLNDSQKPSER